MTLFRDRHRRFQQLHQFGCFVIPNPWDTGSARIMAALGAAALATTSAGFRFHTGPAGHGAIRDAMHSLINRGSFEVFVGAAKKNEIDELLREGETQIN